MLNINHGDDSIPDLIIYSSEWKQLGKNHLIFFNFMFKVIILIKVLILCLLHKKDNRLIATEETNKIRNQSCRSH